MSFIGQKAIDRLKQKEQLKCEANSQFKNQDTSASSTSGHSGESLSTTYVGSPTKRRKPIDDVLGGILQCNPVELISTPPKKIPVNTLPIY